MAGPHDSKIKLDDAQVYIHKKDDKSGSRQIHIDVEHPDLNRIIKPGENSFVGGKNGGLFIGLKTDMIERAKDFLTSRDE